jgi:hypothetical protein
MATTASPDADILAGYAEQDEFAKANRISSRTVARYRNQPNGLPWVEFGGKVRIPLDLGKDWLRSRIRNPNQRRKAG